MIDGIIHIKEADPETAVILSPTVPVSCPPCTMTLGMSKSLGLELSECSVTFSGIDGQPKANQSVMIKALSTSGSFSRVARIVFSPIVDVTHLGSPWEGYKPVHCPVLSLLFFIYFKLFYYTPGYISRKLNTRI